jgi:ABC-type sugar transport system ATPase subunit
MASLRIAGLGKQYGRAGDWALKDFSLTVEDGELVAIVGPSGCGKSTLLRMLAGLEAESAGTVHLGDRMLGGLPPKDRDVALMFQSYTLLPHLTVEENLAFGLKLRGVPKAERLRRAREAADVLGLNGLLERLPSEISGGERQRAALGRAILRAPSAFLFDEPLSSLDAQMRLQLRVEIQRLHQRVRVPMLFVTHDQSEALTLGDRVLVLNRGAIQQVAPPDELYVRPANAFVASFIGAPGMNLFTGQVTTDQTGGRHFASAALNLSLPPALAGRVTHLADGAALTLGVRPEHLRRSPPGDSSLVGDVTAVERQAGQVTLYLNAGNVAFAAKAGDDHAARHGDSTSWTFDTAHLYLFDGHTGAALYG